MIEIKHNTLKLRNQESFEFETVPGLVLGFDEDLTESVVEKVSYVKDGDEIKQLIFEMTYPVGKVIHTTRADNPSTYLGGGTWEQIKDVFLLAAGDTYAAGTTGGETEHTLTNEELPLRTVVRIQNTTGSSKTTSIGTWSGGGSVANNDWASLALQDAITAQMIASAGNAHNNMPPYKAVYVWERVA